MIRKFVASFAAVALAAQDFLCSPSAMTDFALPYLEHLDLGGNALGRRGVGARQDDILPAVWAFYRIPLAWRLNRQMLPALWTGEFHG